MNSYLFHQDAYPKNNLKNTQSQALLCSGKERSCVSKATWIYIKLRLNNIECASIHITNKVSILGYGLSYSSVRSSYVEEHIVKQNSFSLHRLQQAFCKV